MSGRFDAQQRNNSTLLDCTAVSLLDTVKLSEALATYIIFLPKQRPNVSDQKAWTGFRHRRHDG
jgi:hypothetical protein